MGRCSIRKNSSFNNSERSPKKNINYEIFTKTIFLPFFLSAQDFFEPLGGPTGVSVESCFKDANGVLYARTKSLTHLKSLDDGGTWTPMVINDSIQTMRLFSDEASNLFAFDTSGMFYKSNTNGQVWESISIASNNPFFSDLSISPSGDLYYYNADGLQFSENKGDFWSLLYDEEFLWKEIVFHPNGDMYSLIFVDHISLARSTNGGNSWEKIYGPPAFKARSVHISKEGIIYLKYATDGLFLGQNFLISHDNGFSFESLSLGEPEHTTSAFVTNEAGDILYNHHTEILLSKNQGQSWADISAGLPEEAVINHIYIDTDQYIYLSLDNNVLYKSILPSDQITSTDEQLAATFQSHAFPNPFDDFFKIQLKTSYSDKLTVQLWDKQGLSVTEEHTTGKVLTIQTEGLPSGVYFYQVTLKGEAIAAGKVVK